MQAGARCLGGILWHPLYITAAFFYCPQNVFCVPQVGKNLGLCETEEYIYIKQEFANILAFQGKDFAGLLSFGGFFSKIRWQEYFFSVLQLVYRVHTRTPTGMHGTTGRIVALAKNC